MKNQSACDPELIHKFLMQQLSDAEQLAFESHLDNCIDCCHQLEASVANNEIWTGVRELSSSTQGLSGNLVLDSATSDELTFSRSTVLDFLSPTDDDRMMGRLGAYEVLGIVGTGGMGVVLKAFDAPLNRYVAIKVLAPHLGSSGAAGQRFAREAQAAAAVVHDNVIEIYGVADIDGLPYLIMPYVPGPSLQKRLDDKGPFTLLEILRVSMQAAAGLAAAHAQGLVHRDVKPANILLADGVERVKLTDFGLARAVDDASLTRTGVIAGTPQYMSPEQSRGEQVGFQSDLFSLGSVMYAMCVGRPPFRAETSYGVIQRINNDSPTAPHQLNSSIPEWLSAIIKKLMHKQPSECFGSAHQVSKLLEGCLAHVQQPATVPLPASIPKSDAKRSSMAKLAWLGGAVAVVMAVFGSIGMFYRTTEEPHETPSRRVNYAGENVDIDPTIPTQSLLHYCEADGTPVRPFVQNARIRRLLNRQGTPDISADGKKVVFDAWAALGKWQSSQIIVTDIRGRNAHVICDGFMPSLSPDGAQLAISRHPKYTEADGVVGCSIWIINADGSSKRMIADKGAWGARWSGDGKSLVFYSGVDEEGRPVKENCLRLVDLETYEISNIFGPEESPFQFIEFQFDWAWGEQRLVAFSGVLKESGKRVSATVDVDVGIESLNMITDLRIGRERNMGWHPNGRWLLVTDSDYGRSPPVHVSITANGVVPPDLPGLPDYVRASDATYTPDGKHLIMSLLAGPDSLKSSDTGSTEDL